MFACAIEKHCPITSRTWRGLFCTQCALKKTAATRSAPICFSGCAGYRANAGPSDEIGNYAFFFKDLEDAHVSEAAGETAAESQPDATRFWFFQTRRNVGALYFSGQGAHGLLKAVKQFHGNLVR